MSCAGSQSRAASLRTLAICNFPRTASPYAAALEHASTLAKQ